jgi:hypothetical protein
MTVVLPSKLRAIQSVNKPLFTPVQEENRKTWQELTAAGVLAVEFPAASTRVWMRDGTRRDFERAANPGKVATWIVAQGFPVYGTECPKDVRSDVLHTDEKIEVVMALSDAMAKKGRVWIRYAGRARGEETEREVTPLAWRSYGSELGFTAQCHLRGEERAFVVARIIVLIPLEVR